MDLKPRYEAHHKGVKIKDSALVAAAELSQRYIADRFLPDKAIDLMDEATSRLAMELESVPEEIDQVQRKLMQLELAARQLSRRNGGACAATALADINALKCRSLKRELADLREQWETEKLGVGDVAQVRQQLQVGTIISTSKLPPRLRSISRPGSRSPRRCSNRCTNGM